MNNSEDTEEIKTFPLYPYLLQGQQTLPSCKPISVRHPGDAKYTTPLPHPTTPGSLSQQNTTATTNETVPNPNLDMDSHTYRKNYNDSH